MAERRDCAVARAARQGKSLFCGSRFSDHSQDHSQLGWFETLFRDKYPSGESEKKETDGRIWRGFDLTSKERYNCMHFDNSRKNKTKQKCSGGGMGSDAWSLL